MDWVKKGNRGEKERVGRRRSKKKNQAGAQRVREGERWRIRADIQEQRVRGIGDQEGEEGETIGEGDGKGANEGRLWRCKERKQWRCKREQEAELWREEKEGQLEKSWRR